MTCPRRRATLSLGLGLAVGAVATGGLTACVSVGSSDGAAPLVAHLLHDPGARPARLAQPLVAALLIQPQTGDAQADTVAIAYSRRANEFANYQLASWTDSPVRQLPRLLQRRLEDRGVAAAVGMLGDPLRSEWLLAVAIDSLHHDVATEPGRARLALSVELFDRRSRTRVARRQFNADEPAARADSAAAAAAMSQALGVAFDQIVPWLEAELQRALAARP